MQTAHWLPLAAVWEQVASPLRPAPEDLHVYARLVQPWIEQHGAPRVLLLGVTPEIYRLRWPAGRDFQAVDRSPAMIEHVWPGRPEEVLQADWLDLPLPGGSRDLAICDGGLHLLEHPHGQQRLVENLHRVLAPGGLCLFRLYALPEVAEAPAAVLAELMAGGIPNLNVLKLRLGMAMQASPGAGVRLRDIWRELHVLADDWESLAARLGWPLEHLQVIEAYRDSEAAYHFLSVADTRALFCAGGGFVFREMFTPTYQLGERCPIMVFERQ
jgi:SAM-dependent methyltransferase